MPRRYSSKWIVRVLLRRGFVEVSQRGSHLKLRRLGLVTRTVIVPVGRKVIPVGTFKSILRQSGLTEEDFKRK